MGAPIALIQPVERTAHLPAAPLAIAPMRVAGVIVVAFRGLERAAWLPDDMDEAVQTFPAGQVELIDGHHATGYIAPVVGYLDTLARCPEGLRFTGAEDGFVVTSNRGFANAHAFRRSRAKVVPCSSRTSTVTSSCSGSTCSTCTIGLP